MNNETNHDIQDDTTNGAATELTPDALEQCRGGMDQAALDAIAAAFLQDSIQMQRFGGMHGGSAVERMAREAHANDNAPLSAVSSAFSGVTISQYRVPVL
jgi:hypothetical protein